MIRTLLIGNPNCGKTTLFNTLTGDNQRVGNWPGVTVEKKTGSFMVNDQPFEITDLPGVYTLSTTTDESSQDSLITSQAVSTLPIDLIINVLDACHLERHLYLTSQLIELRTPMIVVLNMADIALQQGISFDLEALTSQLSCPVVIIQAHKKIGLSALKSALSTIPNAPQDLDLDLPLVVKKFLSTLEKKQGNSLRTLPLAFYQANRLGESATGLDCAPADLDIILADARYKKINQIVKVIQKKRSDMRESITAKIDRIVLHRIWGLPIFLGVMYLMFLFAVNIGGAFQDFFDLSTKAIFVQGFAVALHGVNSPQWLIALLANGVGVGINTTLTFIPVIAAMFFFLSFLEASGYMARAAFVVDRIMRFLGLPGQSFVPMIVGFGCNVPAIMAARTLDSEQDRLLTVLMSPFMSCSARLSIYAVFVAAFFPVGGQNIVFSLYLTGIIMAVLTGLLLRKTLLKGQPSPLILELPTYHRPLFKRLCKDAGTRLRFFVTRAGRLIVPVCVILGGLNALTVSGGLSEGAAHSNSLLSYAGKWLTPLFAPMGLHQDNWPATVGLLTGTLAKEVVVGTLNALYAPAELIANAAAHSFDCVTALKEAFLSIPHNLVNLSHAFINPIAASAPDNSASQSIYGIMATRFDGKIGAFAYLLFILLYIPCVSTMAAIRQEASKQLMWFSILWSFLIAYAAAVIFYQSATSWAHPLQSFLWVMSMCTAIALFVGVLYCRQFHNRKRYAYANT